MTARSSTQHASRDAGRDLKLHELRAELEVVSQQQRELLGRLCVKAGLANTKVPTAELEAALREVAARFRQSTSEPAIATDAIDPAALQSGVSQKGRRDA
jgi:hypothetical protein